MKKNLWLIFGAMLSTSLLAQPVTSKDGETVVRPQQALIMPAPTNDTAPIEAPAPAGAITSAPAAQTTTAATNAPAKKAPKKKARRKTAAKKAPAPELKTVPLVPGPAVVQVSPSSRVNVRGRPGLIGEVITQVTNGEPVTVIEEIDLKHSGPEEPSAWAKIVLPDKAHAWVFARYVDENNTITANKLNLRGGPGENYSILGRLQKGDTVQKTGEKGNWIEIAPPTNAYAFMAAQYLNQQAPEVASTAPAEATNATPGEAAATPSEVAGEPKVAEAETPSLPETLNDTNQVASDTNTVAMTDTNEVAPEDTNALATAQPESEEPPPRIVAREGIVRATFSIQAPTEYELISPDNRQTIDYLYTTTTNLDLSRYKGLHIIVTGPEGLDQRWKNTPVITIQKIQVLD